MTGMTMLPLFLVGFVLPWKCREHVERGLYPAEGNLGMDPGKGNICVLENE
jgi:hypothetical protein